MLNKAVITILGGAIYLYRNRLLDLSLRKPNLQLIALIFNTNRMIQINSSCAFKLEYMQLGNLLAKTAILICLLNKV